MAGNQQQQQEAKEKQGGKAEAVSSSSSSSSSSSFVFAAPEHRWLEGTNKTQRIVLEDENMLCLILQFVAARDKLASWLCPLVNRSWRLAVHRPAAWFGIPAWDPTLFSGTQLKSQVLSEPRFHRLRSLDMDTATWNSSSLDLLLVVPGPVVPKLLRRLTGLLQQEQLTSLLSATRELTSLEVVTHPQTAVIPLLPNMPSLRDISLRCENDDVVAGLEPLFNKCPSLTSITWHTSAIGAPPGFVFPASAVGLQKLSLHVAPPAVETLLVALPSLPNLRCLRSLLCGFGAVVNPSTLAIVGQSCPLLTEVQLLWRLPPHSLLELAQHTPKLIKLDVSMAHEHDLAPNAPTLTQQADLIFCCWPLLESLKLDNDDSWWLAAVGRFCPALTDLLLRLDDPSLGLVESLTEALPAWPLLRALSIEEAMSHLTDDEMGVLFPLCAQLQSLTLSNLEKGCLFEVGQHLTSLRTLVIHSYGYVLPEGLLAPLSAGCPYLTELFIHDHAEEQDPDEEALSALSMHALFEDCPLLQTCLLDMHYHGQLRLHRHMDLSRVKRCSATSFRPTKNNGKWVPLEERCMHSDLDPYHRMLRCGGCPAPSRPRYYCSQACHEKDWPMHQWECANLIAPPLIDL